MHGVSIPELAVFWGGGGGGGLVINGTKVSVFMTFLDALSLSLVLLLLTPRALGRLPCRFFLHMWACHDWVAAPALGAHE